MQPLLNPYIAGAPIVEPSMFFGRQDVFQWIERNLSGKYVDHILVIHGQRRVGKTSVLKQIPNFLPKTYIQVFFDLQGRTTTTLDRFLWWLGREIARVARQSHSLAVPAPDQAAFTSDADYLYAQFLPGLKPLLGEHKLLLTFDEFDTLEQPEIRETLGRPLIDYLRRLFELEYLNFIFSIGSSGRKLENMQASYTDFFKTALYRKISFLSKDDCQQLIAGRWRVCWRMNRRPSSASTPSPAGTLTLPSSCATNYSRCARRRASATFPMATWMPSWTTSSSAARST